MYTFTVHTNTTRLHKFCPSENKVWGALGSWTIQSRDSVTSSISPLAASEYSFFVFPLDVRILHLRPFLQFGATWRILAACIHLSTLNFASTVFSRNPIRLILSLGHFLYEHTGTGEYLSFSKLPHLRKPNAPSNLMRTPILKI